MTRWIVGWNVPGYLPDTEPYAHDSFEEARTDLIEELHRSADDYSEEAPVKPYLGAADEARNAPAEEAFEVHVGDHVWWINPAA